MIETKAVQLLRRALVKLENLVGNTAHCDHSVGICECDLVRLAKDIKDYLPKQEA